MVNRGGKVCLAAFPHEQVPVDIAHIVRNNIYLYGIRGEGKSATHRAVERKEVETGDKNGSEG
jgi:L-iditol 2-dehydrogenase